jgi:hypothetical protein
MSVRYRTEKLTAPAVRRASHLMGLRRSQFVLCKFAVREMRQCLIAQPSLRLCPRLDLAMGEEAVESVAQPDVEARIIEPRHLEMISLS